MTHRFYCPTLSATGSVSLDEAEAHHLAHVMRRQPGDEVELFNGAGLVATCWITAISKRGVTLDVISSHQQDSARTKLILATAVPKGDRFDWLVEKSTELGVSQLVPITTQRSIVDPRDSKLDKLRQTVITACKQSGRNDLMKISSVTNWPDFLDQYRDGHQLLIAHPGGETLDSVLSSADKTVRPIAIAIGPEGGFTDDEVKAAQDCGAMPVSLGPCLLRIETAALGAAAKVLL